jgi:hypothetical protein
VKTLISSQKFRDISRNFVIFRDMKFREIKKNISRNTKLLFREISRQRNFVDHPSSGSGSSMEINYVAPDPATRGVQYFKYQCQYRVLV